MQSVPSHSIALIHGITFSFCLCPGLPCGLFPSGFLTKTLYVFIYFPICATCPAYLFDLIDSSMTYEAPHYTVFSLSLLHPVRAVFSNAIRLLSSLNMRDQVPCP